MTIQQAFELAEVQFQQRRYAEAEALCKKILDVEPNRADTLQLLGLIAAQTQRIDLGIAMLKRTLSINPANAATHYNLGCAYASGGRFAEAIGSLTAAISITPDLLEAIVTLGSVYLAQNRLDDAIGMYERAIEVNSNSAEAHTNLGNALRAKGLLDSAVSAYQRAIALKPDLADAHYNLAIVLKDQQQHDQARLALERVIQLQPDNIDARNMLGVIYQLLGQRQAAELTFHEALSINSRSAQACNNLGKLAHDAGKFDEAINWYRRAIVAAPQWALPHYNYSLTLLLKGDFTNGWQEFEWRRRAMELAVFSQNFKQPLWDGTSRNRKVMLIHAEQGFGDAIQFSRYINLVAAQGGRVIFQCHPQLRKLFTCFESVSQVLSIGEPIPHFDLHCPLLSLPRLCKTDPSNMPASIPYLQPDRKLVEVWRERLAVHDGHKKIGLVWKGRPHPPGRSVPLSDLAPLGEVKGAVLISLQIGESAASAGIPIADYTGQINDFSDTAALLANLDLLITIDTAAAHLAGALGLPTWVLLSDVPDWRWMLKRDDSPWYPSMRLFRQSTAGDWSEPINKISALLK